MKTEKRGSQMNKEKYFKSAQYVLMVVHLNDMECVCGNTARGVGVGECTPSRAGCR